MEANGEASKAPSCSKPRIFKAPQGHCLGQASSAICFVTSQLGLKQLEIAIRSYPREIPLSLVTEVVGELLEKRFNTVALKIFTSVKSSTFSTLFFCGEKGRFTTQSAGPAALFISLCSHFVFLVMGRSHMLLISNPSMSLVVALLMMFVSDVLSQAESGPNSCTFADTSIAEENAVNALYTGWGILSAMGGDNNCSDPCGCGWEGVICVQLVQPAVAPGSCTLYMPTVIGLTITGNPGLTGNLPSEIGSLSNLTVLDLHDNNFTGLIPNLALLANLQILSLNGNAFSGSIEHVLQGLNAPLLVSMDLSSNQLTGCIPGLTTGLGNYSGFSATFLNVSHNHIGGYFNISNQFNETDLLTTLDLSFNNISGDISTVISFLYGLYSPQILLINNNHFSGKLPDFSTSLDTITNLDLSNNQLSGIIPPSIWNISRNLTVLNLSGNNFFGNLPNVTNPQSLLETLSMSKNQLNGELPDLSSFPQLKTLDLSDNQFNGSILPSIWTIIPKLNVLNLSNNKLHGKLPTMKDLQYCPNSLKSLNLGGNKLTGLFPSNLFNCSFILQEVNFDNNNFNGILDLQINLTKHLVFGTLISMVNNNIIQLNPSWESGIYSPVLLGGNPCCSIVTSENPTIYQQQNCRYNSSTIPIVTYKSSNSQELHKKLAWVLSTILPSFVFVSGIIFIIIYWKYHKNMSTFREIQKEFAKQQVQPILYSYNVLKAATKDFHPSNKLGEGGFGAVYKGILLDGTHVAVKLLNKSHQQVSEFLNEIVLMTGVRHKNLVKVKGCSLQGTQRLIVFEFVENKNLAEALWDRPIKNVLLLDWTMRFNICVGIAHGLIYLHEYLQPRIIHRDIKASNILLDKDLNPKIADFGLARLFPEDISHLSTDHIAGTMGYLSPEYATLGKLTEKVDVFSYGVLLLEIVSGRKNIDLSLETNKIYLLEWAHSLHEQDKLFDLIDQQLNNNILDDEAQRVIDVALLCVQTSASRRPLMSHVLAMLLNGVDMEVVSKETNSIHEMEISSLLGFHHVVPNNHGNVEIELSTLDPN
ncbi:hypothetical protein BDL97_02G123200 [Sphagnum fallax]|nr:hypothetical protein BDL97_02G123200 [Sphagnum fallax]